MSRENSFGQSVYDTTADLGFIKTKIYLGIAIVIAIVLIIVSIVLFFKDQSNLIDVTGKVHNVVFCNKNKDPKSKHTSYECELTVVYNVNSTGYVKNIQTNDKLYNIDENIELTYNKTNPNEVSLSVVRYRTISYILFGIAVLLVGLSYLSYYLSTRSKLYSAVVGAQTVVSL